MDLEEARRIVSSPSDQAEIAYWTIETYGSNPPHLKHHRFKYHLRTAWASLYEPPGADLVDEWQIFTNGHFVGRTDTKNLLAHFQHAEGAHWTEDAARRAAITWVDARIAHAQKELADLQSRRGAFA